MKRTKILYWVFTLLFAAFMTYSAIPDVLLTRQAVAFMKDFLGIPNYMTQFIGVAKLLGVITLLIPGFFRLKEWAYAGFAFDLAGAVYWMTFAGGFSAGILVMLVPVTLGTFSYIFYHKMRRETEHNNAVS